MVPHTHMQSLQYNAVHAQLLFEVRVVVHIRVKVQRAQSGLIGCQYIGLFVV